MVNEEKIEALSVYARSKIFLIQEKLDALIERIWGCSVKEPYIEELKEEIINIALSLAD